MTTAEIITTQASAIRSESRPTVLIVDDKEFNRALYADLLKDDGYRILTAESAQQALDLIHTNSVDLALVDVVMPKMTGMACAARSKPIRRPA